MKRTATIVGAWALAAALLPTAAYAAPGAQSTQGTATVSQAAAAAMNQLAGQYGFGQPLGAATSYGTYSVQRYQSGDVYSTTAGTFALNGAIKAHYDTSSAGHAVLGLPVGNPVAAANGSVVQHFQAGQIVWSAGTGAQTLVGAINSAYDRVGGVTAGVGLPTSDEVATRAGNRANAFQHGTIVWSAPTGAHAVQGAVYATYAGYGADGGMLGRPISDEFTTVSGARASSFERGTVIWSSLTGAQAVYGGIYAEYGDLGWDGGVLGRPVSGEFDGQSGARAQRFQGGNIIWSPRTGAHAIRGAIAARYAQLGYEGGSLGAPTSDEYAIPGGAEQRFEHGWIRFVNGATTDSTGSALKSSSRADGNVYNGGSCAWYAYNRRVELGAPVSSHWGAAGAWADAARRDGYTVDHVPQVGAVVSTYAFGASPTYGHVMIVESVNADGSFTVSEMNAPQAWVVTHRTFAASAAVNGWFIH